MSKKPLTTKDDRIVYHFGEIIKLLGLNPDDPNLMETPQRLMKMYRDELFSSVGKQLPDMKMFPLKDSVPKNSQMLVEKNITVQSTCAHHFLPFMGVAHIAYVPGKQVIGLSKMHRIVDYFARKPQLQEDLTVEIGRTLIDILKTDNVAVIVQCKHLCCHVRGVKDFESSTTTSFVHGLFEDIGPRQEFLNLLNLPR